MDWENKFVIAFSLMTILNGIAPILICYSISPRNSLVFQQRVNCNLREPNYQEVKEFLTRNTTDSNEWTLGSWLTPRYVCLDFAADLKDNARKEKMLSACVIIWFGEKTAPAIVAFKTRDKGVIFI